MGAAFFFKIKVRYRDAKYRDAKFENGFSFGLKVYNKAWA